MAVVGAPMRQSAANSVKLVPPPAKRTAAASPIIAPSLMGSMMLGFAAA
jgi:hypothetical protein